MPSRQSRFNLRMEFGTHEPGAGRPGRQDVRFAVRLTPRGGADTIDGVSPDGVLHARVTAPAVGGAANAALLRLVADELDVSRTSVRLVAGAAGRQKLVVVDGINPEAVTEHWPGIKL